MKNLVKTTWELTETKQHADELRNLANRDALTGIRNKNAYDELIRKLEEDLKKGKTKFGFAMVDLNFLKKINDQYGHEKCNLAIKKLCKLVCEVFKHSPVFRIGGDEFVVVLRNRDYESIDRLVKDFNDSINIIAEDIYLQPWDKISAAIGVALYDPAIDKSVNEVFMRADAAMYKRKQDMKAAQS